jgi:outer membrane lipoprotein carrier protein
MRRLISFAISTVVLCAGIANAQEAKDAGQVLLEDFLQNVITLSGRFEQQLIDADNNVLEESVGTLDIRRPGQFRWSYSEPYEQVLIADGLNMWSYDVDLEQVTVKPQAEALGSTPALLLGGSADVLEDFNYIGSFADRGTQWVLLRPKDTESGFYKVELGFTDGHLTRMLFGDNLEQTTLIALVDVAFNEPVDEETFSFSPPDGVDVVGAPVTEH